MLWLHNSKSAEHLDLVVGHIEIEFGGGHWGVIALDKQRHNGKNIWKWVCDTAARRWTLLVDTAALPASRRPLTQQLQARALATLGLLWCDESIATPILHSGRIASVRIDLAEAHEQFAQEEGMVEDNVCARRREALQQVTVRCVGWDTARMWQISCEQRVWLVNGTVWDAGTTVHVAVDGTVPESAVKKCSGWGACGLCHELAGVVRVALPRRA
eukprot:gene5063-3768_t